MTATIPQTSPDYDRARIIERPDGFFWQDKQTGEQYGPFATLLEAVDDMRADDDAALEVAETLSEAEAELGIGDWYDEDTGDLVDESLSRRDDE